MKFFSMNLIALLVTCVLCGCGAKRTELGYGFYELDDPAGHIIRRERNGEGEVIDQNWWPSSYNLKGRSLLFSSKTDKCLIFCLSPDGSIAPKDAVTREESLKFLHSTVEIIVLRLDEAAFHELGTYNDFAARFDPDDPIRVQVDQGFNFIAGLVAWLSDGD